MHSLLRMSHAGKARTPPTPFYIASVAIAVALGAWLRWPALHNGFFSDDFVQAAMLEGAYAAPRGPLDLFAFAKGSESDNAQLLRVGALPWWSSPGLRLSMLRPLSSALVSLDRACSGTSAFAYHLHSLAWWVLLMSCVAWLLRETLSERVAALSLVIFALEEGHTLPLGWLANRGALVAMTFGVLGLILHRRARRAGRRFGGTRAFVCFALALLAGEWAFPILGYVVACELLAQNGPLRSRLLALAPYALVGGAFLVARAALGYGVRNSGVYIDPLSEPASFLLAASQRIPVFFADLVFSVPANWWGLGTPWRERVLSLLALSPSTWLALPSWRFWHVALGVLALVATVVALRVGLRERTVIERREVRWLLAGALLALLPMVASFPTSRLVLPAALATSPAAALIALASLSRARVVWRAAGRRRLLRCAFALLPLLLVAYFQLWQAGRTSYAEARVSAYGYASVRDAMLSAELDERRVAGQHVWLISSLEHTSSIFMPYVRWFYGHTRPLSTHVLSASPHAHEVYRPAPNVLEMTTLGGTFFESEVEQLYRAPRFVSRTHDRIELPGFSVEVLRVLGDRPRSVRFTFARDVDDPSYVFLETTPAGVVRARLPEVGQRVRYRRAAVPNRELRLALRQAGTYGGRVACQGSRPSIDECRVGFFFADCGGQGSPVFACHGFGDCRWFAHACVADEYEASPCAPSSPCCMGASPFAPEAFPAREPYARVAAAGFFAWGDAPWDGARDLVIPVQIDAKLLPTQPKVGCAGPAPAGGPCDVARASLFPGQPLSLRFAWRGPRDAGGWDLTVEVIDGRDGVLRARVCRTASAVARYYEPPGNICEAAAPPSCAHSGRVVLSRFPIDASAMPGLGARLEAQFPDGVVLQAEL